MKTAGNVVYVCSVHMSNDLIQFEACEINMRINQSLCLAVMYSVVLKFGISKIFYVF